MIWRAVTRASAVAMLLAGVLGGAPGPGLHARLPQGLAVSRAAAPDATAPPDPLVLPRPPFAYFRAVPAPATAPRVRLVKVSEARNRITDVEQWFQDNGLALPLVAGGEMPAEVPLQYRGHALIRAIRDRDALLLIYGPDGSGGRYLLGRDPRAGRYAFSLDFRHYVVPPAYLPEDRGFVDERLQWAQTRDGLLYVSNFHLTYARSSRGLNAYITALDPARGAIRWRSRPLVSNSRTFVIVGDAIVTGYGFTAEPDFLYLLDRRTGAVIQTLRLRSGPEYIVVKGDRAFVRTYDTNYVFRIIR